MGLAGTGAIRYRCISWIICLQLATIFRIATYIQFFHLIRRTIFLWVGFLPCVNILFPRKRHSILTHVALITMVAGAFVAVR